MTALYRNIRWKIAQAIEIRWWQNYLKAKTKTEYLAWKKEYWQNFLTTTGVQINKESSILDLGCGPAGIFIIFDEQKVVALDPLLDSYETKLKHFRKEDYPNVQFLNQPLEQYDTNQKGDAVFCLNAINHVDDLDKCFDVLVAATVTKGDLIVSIDAHNYPLFKHLFRFFQGDILHPHQYDLEEYEKMLTDRKCIVKDKILYKKEFFFDYYILVAQKN